MKKWLTIAAVLSQLLLLSACSKPAGKSAASSSASTTGTGLSVSGDELTVGILPAESAIPIILAEEKGYFDALGLPVTIQTFSSPNDRNVAVQAKELDGTIADVMTVASFVDKGLAMKITSDISEDFKVLSSPGSGITSMEQLKGKRVSLVPNFILEYIMDQYAAEYGFTYEIVEIASFSGRAEALMANQIDGVVFTEPTASMLVKQGAHLLGSSKEKGIKGGALLFTQETIANRPNDIRAFYQAYNRAVDYMNSTDASEYSAILSRYQFPDAIGTYLTNMTEDVAHAGPINQDQFDRIVAWTKNKGQISKTYAYSELTDFTLIP